METRESRLGRAVELRDQGDLNGSCTMMKEIVHDFPDDPEICFQAAWSHDKAGLEEEASVFYEHALRTPGLAPADRQEALLGLGSSYRLMGRLQDAVRVLQEGMDEFPENTAIRVFMAIAYHAAGQHGQATGMFLDLLAETSADPMIMDYRRPIREYAKEFQDG